MKKIIIAAVADNRAIGQQGELSWNMPADIAFLEKQIEGAFLLTGRSSYESEQGKELFSKRDFVVLTSRKDYKVEAGFVAHSMEEAFEIAGQQAHDRFCILGGAKVYEQTINVVDELIITEIHTIIDDADAFFPIIDLNIWTEVHRKDYSSDEEHAFPYSFVFYERK
jgi:dihydrofolate reductase